MAESVKTPLGMNAREFVTCLAVMALAGRLGSQRCTRCRSRWTCRSTKAWTDAFADFVYGELASFESCRSRFSIRARRLRRLRGARPDR